MTPEQKFQSDVTYRIHRLQHFAKKYGWYLQRISRSFISFEKDGAYLQFCYSHLSIATVLDHPKYGRTKLERTGQLSQKIIESIFRNPRHHMGKKVKSRYLDHQV